MKFLLVLSFWILVFGGAFGYRQYKHPDSPRYWDAWWDGFYQNWTQWMVDDSCTCWEPIYHTGYSNGCGCRCLIQIVALGLAITAGLVTVCGSLIWSLF